MEKVSPQIDEVIDEVKEYVNVSLDLYKLKATEKGAMIASTAIINILLGAFAAMALLFVSFAAAYAIAEMTGKIYLGFLAIAGFYALIGLLILATKDKWLKNSLVDSIIKSIYAN